MIQNKFLEKRVEFLKLKEIQLVDAKLSFYEKRLERLENTMSITFIVFCLILIYKLISKK